MNINLDNFCINRKMFIVFLCLFFVFIFTGCTKQNNAPNQHIPTDQNGQLNNNKQFFYSLLDGKIIDQEEDKNPFVALMIDNFIDSRPVSGINSTSIVYEVPVEAGITRFMGIFELNNLPEKIGPIRSARPYFAGLAEEYEAIYAHAGGSPQVINELKEKKYNIFNLDEISANGIYFWRDNSRISPFKLYTSRDLINKFIQKKGIANYSDFRPWYFQYQVEKNDDSANQRVEIGSYKEPVLWKYDSEQKIYLRYQNNKPYLDVDNNQVSTVNLIVQKTPIIVIDAIGRREIKIRGRGTAYIYMNGEKIDGNWIRENNRTIFYDQEGGEIKFLRGNIWIEIIGEK